MTDFSKLTWSGSEKVLKIDDRSHCLAYKIEAKNLGNVKLTDIKVSDTLQLDTTKQHSMQIHPDTKPILCGHDDTSASTCDASKVSTTGTAPVTVNTSDFWLPATGNKTAILYFNTQYPKS